MSPFNADSEINELTSNTRLRKEEAKEFRDDGDIVAAIDTLLGAVATLDGSPLAKDLTLVEVPSPQQKKLAFQLADCLGMLGGNYRRLGELTHALAAFVRGQEIEESEKLEVPSSYNLVNAITLPLEMKTQTPTQLQPALNRAVAAIKRQVDHEERRNDRWAWADLAECQLLLGDLDDAKDSYARMCELGNADTIVSVVAVLRRLKVALESEVQASEALRQAIAWLEVA